MHYRAVMLVLASNNNEIYNNCRKIWKKYMNIDPTIKVYFVYGQLFQPLLDYDPLYDLIYPEVIESYPVTIEKTMKAIEYIDSQITYDFFIRTNLSTFWDFNKLHLHLNELPSQNCYSGDGPLHGYNEEGFFLGFYLSGTDTIVTPEMIKSIINNKHLVNYTLVEDLAMGLYFHGYLNCPLLPNRICFFEDIMSTNENEKIKSRIKDAIFNNKDHYRVKNSNTCREQIDLYIYNILLKMIYNIDS